MLQAADLAAKRRKVNRSILIREALGVYLKRTRIAELEEMDRRGYEACPRKAAELKAWEDAAAWPAN